MNLSSFSAAFSQKKSWFIILKTLFAFRVALPIQTVGFRFPHTNILYPFNDRKKNIREERGGAALENGALQPEGGMT